jgi:hypothetical protein
MRLRIAGAPQFLSQAKVYPSVNGRPLVFSSSGTGPGWLEFELHGIPTDKELKPQFLWPSGRAVNLDFDSEGASAISLEDWEVFLVDKESDSKAKSEWRTLWFWSSLLVFIVYFPTAVWAALSLRERPPPGDPVHACIDALIDQVEGKDKKETAAMRQVLRRVLREGAAIDEALEAASSASPTRRKQVWLRARNRFIIRLVSFQARLEAASISIGSGNS